jgi:hypothetical protein
VPFKDLSDERIPQVLSLPEGTALRDRGCLKGKSLYSRPVSTKCDLCLAAGRITQSLGFGLTSRIARMHVVRIECLWTLRDKLQIVIEWKENRLSAVVFFSATPTRILDSPLAAPSIIK